MYLVGIVFKYWGIILHVQFLPFVSVRKHVCNFLHVKVHLHTLQCLTLHVSNIIEACNGPHHTVLSKYVVCIFFIM